MNSRRWAYLVLLALSVCVCVSCASLRWVNVDADYFRANIHARESLATLDRTRAVSIVSARVRASLLGAYEETLDSFDEHGFSVGHTTQDRQRITRRVVFGDIDQVKVAKTIFGYVVDLYGATGFRWQFGAGSTGDEQEQQELIAALVVLCPNILREAPKSSEVLR